MGIAIEGGILAAFIAVEGIILSAILYLSCAIGIRGGAVNMVFLYGKAVQDRAVELGLTTTERIRTSAKWFKSVGLLVYFVYTAVCVFAINGARGFWPSFWQFTAILWIMGIFDRIVIDVIWVGHTKAWIIPGTEDLMPYITGKDHAFKWFATIVVYPAIAAIICGVMALMLK